VNTPTDPLRVEVALGDRSYPIHIGAGLLAHAGALIAPHLKGGKVLVIADATVAKLHGTALTNSLNAAGVTYAVATFPAGEPNKSLATADGLWQACAQNRIDRAGAIIALGGGVSGDLAGFVAASWMRGIAFIQVPTTLLAMVDSSVGGKTGVNSAAGKNLIGAFKQPSCVVIDPLLIASMDGREYRAGLAEVLKYGVIKDPNFFAWQEANADALTRGEPAAVAYAVAESCRIKAWYVGEDETEQGAFELRPHLRPCVGTRNQIHPVPAWRSRRHRHAHGRRSRAAPGHAHRHHAHSTAGCVVIAFQITDDACDQR
jgi:3-dehydroquinate synthase